MKKIGLCIQYEGINNYGTVLQAYSTKYVIDSMGYDTRLIKYNKKYTFRYIISQMPRIIERGNLTGIQRNRKRKKALQQHLKFKEYMTSSRDAFKDFDARYFTEDEIDEYNGYEELKKNSTNYDSVLVGSDQLWLPAGMRTNFYNLNFVDNSVNKISYATSFGVSKIPKYNIKGTSEYLKRINYLSVREAAGQEIIENLIGKDSYLACDPVFLLSPEEWKQFCSNSNKLSNNINIEYMLTYFLGGNEKDRRAAEEIAKKKCLKLVAIKYMEDYFPVDDTFGEIAPKGLSPEQFVELFRNATCIMTDSFHGTAFSIIFNKPFLTTYRFSNKSKMSKNSRIDSVLTKLKLNKRLYYSGNAIQQMDDPINYIEINKIKDEWRSESFTFLKGALENKHVER